MTTTIRRAAVMLAGLTLTTGAVLGAASPASAATTATTATTQNQSVQQVDRGWGGRDWDFHGLYESRWRCERAGQYLTDGDRDDYECVRSRQWRHGWDRQNRWGDWGRDWDRWGHRHGAWALYVRD